MVLGRIDQYGKMGWLLVTIATFWLAWPLGLALVAFLVGSGRVRAWRAELRTPGTWVNMDGAEARTSSWAGSGGGSGNHAFDDYRKQTLDNLEAEQREFQAFLEQLRAARDKAEFDAFMDQRRRRSGPADSGDAV